MCSTSSSGLPLQLLLESSLSWSTFSSNVPRLGPICFSFKILYYSFTTSMLSAIVRLLVSGSRVMRLNIWRAKSVSAEFSVFKLQVQCFRFDLHRLLCTDWTKHLAQAQDELDKDASVRDLPHRSRLVLELQCWTDEFTDCRRFQISHKICSGMIQHKPKLNLF